MKYVYDGTYTGFLTVVFDAYKIIEEIDIVVESDQLNFFDDCVFSKASIEKAARVEKAMTEKISSSFSGNIYICFKSKAKNKERVLSRVIKLVFIHGLKVINSANKNCREFTSMLKNISSENHKYKGLLRFKRLKNQFLFATIEPENDILEILINHFVKRLKNEKFVIYDRSRKKAGIYENNSLNFYRIENLKINYDKDEDFFEEAWIKFYNCVKIDNRVNKKLMAANMPKKYWQYLPERGYKKWDH